MKQLTFDERNIMLSVFRGQLSGIAGAAHLSVETVRGVLRGKPAYSEDLLRILRERLEIIRLAEAHYEDAKANKENKADLFAVADLFSHGIVT